jgi:hypothetical protein
LDTVEDVTGSYRARIAGLEGLPISLPWNGAGSAIFLELGQITPPTGRLRYGRGEACIAVEWDWRVEYGATVLYGSSDRGPKIAAGIAELQNKTIAHLVIEGAVPELTIVFSNGHVLRTMALLEGDPQWWIRLQSGEALHARRGRLLVGNFKYEMTEAERASFDAAEAAATRWGRPALLPAEGKCSECRWFVWLDGDGHLLDYGSCISSEGPFDGRAVRCDSGCRAFAIRKA